MNISFNLKNPSAEKSPIRVVVNHKGSTFRKAIGVTIPTAKWKKSKNGRQWSTDPILNANLRRLLLTLEERLDEFTPVSEVENILNEVIQGKQAESANLNPDAPRIPTFAEYFIERAEAMNASKLLALSVLKKIILIMGEPSWQDITYAWMETLDDKLCAMGHSQNYRSLIFSYVKVTMRKGARLGYHNLTDYQHHTVSQKVVDNVYLNQQEVDKILAVDLPNKELSITRDIFIVGIYTASRFSDYSRLNTSMIYEDGIHFIQKKTREPVVVPVSTKVLTILKRYNGALPQIPLTTFNNRIPKVCKLAGIDTTVTLRRSEGRDYKMVTGPKYQFCSSHTARRTGATLLYLNGVPTWQCMLITGHKTETSFLKYIKITKEENARSLASNPFFK